MSEVFSADGVAPAATIVLGQDVETTVATSNALGIPYQTAKIIGAGLAVLTFAAATTTVRLRVFRNPAGENVSVFDQTIDVTASKTAALPIGFVDSVANRDAVTYRLTALTASAGAAGTIQVGSSLHLTCVSG